MAFIKDNDALPTPKINAVTPIGNPRYIEADDINNIWNALSEVRTHTGRHVNVKNFGAVGDGVADDTAAVSAARAKALSGTSELAEVFFPPGTYNLSPSTFRVQNSSGLRIIGSGQGRTRIRAVNDAEHGIALDGGWNLNIEIAHLDLIGKGPASGACDGIYIRPGNPGAYGAINYAYNLHDITIRDFGRHAINAQDVWSSNYSRITASNCGHDLFDVWGGNTSILDRCYAQLVSPGRCGYRIHGVNAHLIACNGVNGNCIDNFWGIFGHQPTGVGAMYQAWQSSHGYGLGEMCVANGEEWMCVAAGTSDSSGGPGSNASDLGSRDVTDGTAHWWHLGAADDPAYAEQHSYITMDSCNIEDPGVGLRLKLGAQVNMRGGKFDMPSPVGGPIAVLFDQSGSVYSNSHIGEVLYNLKGMPAWTATPTYAWKKGSRVWHGGQVWDAVATPGSTQPGTDPTKWVLSGTSVNAWANGCEFHSIYGGDRPPMLMGGTATVATERKWYSRRFALAYPAPVLDTRAFTYANSHVYTTRLATAQPINVTQVIVYPTEATYGGTELLGPVDPQTAGSFLWAVTAWLQKKAYAVNQVISNDSGKLYKCITAGTSEDAPGAGPTGTGTDITDGSTHWKYIGPASTNYVVNDAVSVPRQSSGTRLSFRIRNKSGGSLGTLTWGKNPGSQSGAGYNLAEAWSQPADGYETCITFEYSNDSGHDNYGTWHEVCRSTTAAS